VICFARTRGATWFGKVDGIEPRVKLSRTSAWAEPWLGHSQGFRVEGFRSGASNRLRLPSQGQSRRVQAKILISRGGSRGRRSACWSVRQPRHVEYESDWIIPIGCDEGVMGRGAVARRSRTRTGTKGWNAEVAHYSGIAVVPRGGLFDTIRAFGKFSNRCRLGVL
jgi:hypothetical protein